MLQTALMWKVNREFAHAQQTLDEIRCVDLCVCVCVNHICVLL